MGISECNEVDLLIGGGEDGPEFVASWNVQPTFPTVMETQTAVHLPACVVAVVAGMARA